MSSKGKSNMVGNREIAQEVAEGITYAANDLNQYTRISTNGENFTPEYDADGNQTLIQTSTGIWKVQYNGQNRAIKFESEDGRTVITCGYDYMGRRFEKKVTSDGAVTLHERYIYRGYLQIAAYDLREEHAEHPDLRFIIWDPTQEIATRPLAIRENGVWYTYGWDLTKNICELYGQEGFIRTIYTYSPYGQVTAEGDVTQPIQWSSEMYDAELGLVYYDFRYYNPLDGRWTRRDEFLQLFGLNVYAFVGASPLLLSDYLGLMGNETCQDFADNLTKNPGKYSAHIRQLQEKLKKKRCGFPQVKCIKCCDEGLRGEFVFPQNGDRSGNISLCSDNMENAADILETLAHELIHALQFCERDDADENFNSCESVICQEMQAYRESGECQRSDPGNVRSRVIEGAFFSSERKCQSLNPGG